MSISIKFYSVVLFQIVSLIILLVAGIISLDKIRASTDDTIDRVMMMRATSNRVLQRIYTYNDLLKEILLNSDPERDKILSLSCEDYAKKIETSFDDLIEFSHGEAKKATESAKSDFAKLRRDSDTIRSLALQNQAEEGYELYIKSTLDTQEKIYKSVRFVTEEATKETESAKAKDISLFEFSKWLMLGVFFASVVIGFGFAYLILRSLNKSVTHTVTSLFQSAQQINGEAKLLTYSAERLSGAANEQSSSLEETSAAIEELNSMVSRNSESAAQSSLAVKRA